VLLPLLLFYWLTQTAVYVTHNSCKRKSKNVKDVHNKIIEGARNHDKNDDNKKGGNKSDDKNKNKGGGGSDDKGKNDKGGNKLLRGVDA
jgi:hypothetical protein